MRIARHSAFAIFFILLCVSNASADQIPRRRVMVLSIRDFRLDINKLFFQENEQPDTIADSLTKVAINTLEADPELIVVREKDLERPGVTGIVARGFLHLGQELYRNLRQKDAVDALSKGLEAAASDFIEVLIPELASDLYLFEGLSRLEQGDAPMAHVAFKNMFFLTPQRRFKKGYFPASIEAAIRAAAVDFINTYPLDMPFGSLSRATAFRQAFDISAVVYIYLARKPNGDSVEVRVFETSGGIALASSLPFTDFESATAQVERSLSAWLACTTLPSRSYVDEKRPRFMMDTTGVYSLFLYKPIRSFFHTAGFGMGFAWQPVVNLDTFARINIKTSFPDRYGDLVEGFTSVRTIIGVGYSGQWDWGRVFLHMGFELLYLSDFVSTENANCKFFGLDAKPWCSETDITRLPSHFLVGANLGTGLNVMLGGPVYLAFQAGVSAYFYPFGSDINFPLTAELGLGYAFY